MKIEKAIIQETLYIAVGTAILSILLQAIFLLTGNWDYTVLLGNLLGYIAAVLNFFLMGLGIQKVTQSATDKPENQIRFSLTLRMLMLVVICIIGAVVPCFNIFAVLIPLLFPSLVIFIQKLVLKQPDPGLSDVPDQGGSDLDQE